ncbi:MAG: hypothetical protein HY674_07430 [Chloroflexi bacterium]|nr:hypothetical protein [Chloroflexota bacterium]
MPSALNEVTGDEKCGVLRAVRERTGVTILHATHNLEEAQKLADRIFVLKDGRICSGEIQTGPGF